MTARGREIGGGLRVWKKINIDEEVGKGLKEIGERQRRSGCDKWFDHQ